MKRFDGHKLASALLLFLFMATFVYSADARRMNRKPWMEILSQSNDEYVLLGWNDLGIHCITPGYKELALLPPFNNLWVQVIKRGDPPKVVTSGVSIVYAIANNTTVEDKTDFWTYGARLFAERPSA